VLVYSTGATLTPRQRAKLTDCFRGVNPRVAMLTSSLLSRAMGTAIGWFNPNFHVFDIDDVQHALDHLRVDGQARRRIAATLEELKRELFGR
jgi:hypothetical protein